MQNYIAATGPNFIITHYENVIHGATVLFENIKKISYGREMYSIIRRNLATFHRVQPVSLTGRPELSSFSQAYTAYLGGRGSRAAVHLSKM